MTEELKAALDKADRTVLRGYRFPKDSRLETPIDENTLREMFKSLNSDLEHGIATLPEGKKLTRVEIRAVNAPHRTENPGGDRIFVWLRMEAE